MQSRFRTFVGVLFCALLIAFQTRGVVSGEPCVPKIDPTGVIPEYQAINACTALGGVVQLEARTYYIEGTVNVKSNTLLEGPSANRKAVLLAAPHLGNQVILYGSGSHYVVRNIVVNGNKLKRDYDTLILGWEDQWVYHKLCDADAWRPANSKFHGKDVKLEDVESINAVCGSAMGLHGERIHVINFRGEGNGFSAAPVKNGVEGTRGWPDRSHQYSDVITMEFCDSCVIENPIIIDPTDLGIVLFGGPNNRITNVVCLSKSAIGFTCVNIARSDTGRADAAGRKWDGRHDGLVIDGIDASAESNTLAAAVVVGTHVFAKDPRFLSIVHNAGEMRNVKVNGAQRGIVVDGVEEFTLVNPPTGMVRGDLGNFNHCESVQMATVGHVKAGVRLPSGFQPMTFDGGECGYPK